MSCPKCNHQSYTLINRQKVKTDKGIIVIELRQCNNCFHRYKVEVVS
jgi:transcriptional regulator NrdR family protein